MYMDTTNIRNEDVYKGTEFEERPAIGLFQFWTETKIDLESGDPKDVDFVEWTRIGDRNEPKTTEKIARLKGNPLRGRPPMPEWAVVEPHYEGWKRGKERAEDGTSFDEWKGVDTQLVRILEELKIYTVEAFCAVPNHQVGGIKYPNVSRWQELAKKFIHERAGSAELRAENDAMREELQAMQERLEAMERDRTPLNQGETAPAKRKPGRPPKQETEAA